MSDNTASIQLSTSCHPLKCHDIIKPCHWHGDLTITGKSTQPSYVLCNSLLDRLLIYRNFVHMEFSPDRGVSMCLLLKCQLLGSRNQV